MTTMADNLIYIVRNKKEFDALTSTIPEVLSKLFIGWKNDDRKEVTKTLIASMRFQEEPKREIYVIHPQSPKEIRFVEHRVDVSREGIDIYGAYHNKAHILIPSLSGENNSLVDIYYEDFNRKLSELFVSGEL